ncbi:MAG: DMT family transporter [Phormidesmis sp.]|mgnify:CR=1 FL=1
MTDVVTTGRAVGGGPFLGEGAALLAAFLWAAATLMFGRLGQRLSPLVLNIVKGAFAIAMMVITLLLQTHLSTDAVGLPDLPTDAIVYLAISGALGIGLGDTAYFSAINTLGARRALLLETLAPPMAAVLAWAFLREQLSLSAVAGIALTLIGIAWVISERVPGTTAQKTGAGIKIALLATFCQASGAVLSRAALAETAVSPLWSGLTRLSAGLLLMSVLAFFRIEPAQDTKLKRLRWKSAIDSLRSPRLLGAVAIAAFFGTYLGIWLQQVALKHTAAGIAQALLATSPLFVLPMAAVLGERISWRAVGGAALALMGVWLLIFGTQY